MRREISIASKLTKEEHENFINIINFLQKKKYPLDFKAIFLAGLNQILNTYFEKEWGKPVKK